VNATAAQSLRNTIPCRWKTVCNVLRGDAQGRDKSTESSEAKPRRTSVMICMMRQKAKNMAKSIVAVGEW